MSLHTVTLFYIYISTTMDHILVLLNLLRLVKGLSGLWLHIVMNHALMMIMLDDSFLMLFIMISQLSSYITSVCAYIHCECHLAV